MTNDEDPSENLESQRQREHLRAWQEEGDLEALDALLRCEIRILKAMLRKRGGSLLQTSLAATDVAHEAVLGLLRVRTVPHFDSPLALRGYLWKAAWRLLMQHLRHRERKPSRIDGPASPEFDRFLATTGGMKKAQASDRATALDLAMNLLRPQDREILVLVYFQDLDIPEAARKIGIAVDAANMRLVRARRRLAEKLSGWAELIR
jgi:RNA polymerase sigma-70 factor (ECF subfamily)